MDSLGSFIVKNTIHVLYDNHKTVHVYYKTDQPKIPKQIYSMAATTLHGHKEVDEEEFTQLVCHGLVEDGIIRHTYGDNAPVGVDYKVTRLLCQ